MIDAVLRDPEAEFMARRAAVDGRFVHMVARVAVQIALMGIVGIVRKFPGSLGDLQEIAVARDACACTFRAHGRHPFVTAGAIHAGPGVLIGQQVRPRGRWDAETRWRKQDEKDEKN